MDNAKGYGVDSEAFRSALWSQVAHPPYSGSLPSGAWGCSNW